MWWAGKQTVLWLCLILLPRYDAFEQQDLSKDFLLVVDQVNATIYIGDMDTFDLSPLPLGNLTYPVAIDYDPRAQMVYWTDFSDKMIIRAHIDGSLRQILISTNISEPDGLAVDPESRLMFWTDGEPRSVIERATMNGRERRLIATTDRPRAIVADTTHRHIYWSSWGQVARIERADYDGSNRIVLVGEDIMWPNGIALNFADGLLYWCDAKSKTFESADLLGNDRRMIANLNIYPTVPFGLALYGGDTLFWTDWNTRTIMRMRMMGSNSPPSSSPIEVSNVGPFVLERAGGVHVHVHPVRQRVDGIPSRRLITNDTRLVSLKDVHSTSDVGVTDHRPSAAEHLMKISYLLISSGLLSVCVFK